jgi:mono/diheme cytochrome c family protein
MHIVFAAMVFLAFLVHAASAAAQGNPEAGQTLWTGNVTECRNCHGDAGEGGFGPDLAGRRLTVEQFRHATRSPWGIMPAYTEQQVSDQDIANLVAYFDTLPSVATPGPWRVQAAPGAPARQQLHVATVGCGQCHGPAFADTRQDAGLAGADFAWFADLVYNHTAASPEERRLSGANPDNPIRMGNYSRARLPESLLQEIWQYVSVDLGLRVPISGRLSAGTPAGANVTYALTVENAALIGKGLTAEGLTIALTLPSGSRVVNAGGAGYEGVRPDPDAGADVAVWTLARLAPKERQTYAITISPPAAGAKPLRGTVRWSKPAFGDGSTDSANINPPPALQQ